MLHACREKQQICSCTRLIKPRLRRLHTHATASSLTEKHYPIDHTISIISTIMDTPRNKPITRKQKQKMENDSISPVIAEASILLVRSIFRSLNTPRNRDDDTDNDGKDGRLLRHLRRFVRFLFLSSFRSDGKTDIV